MLAKFFSSITNETSPSLSTGIFDSIVMLVSVAVRYILLPLVSISIPSNIGEGVLVGIE